MKWAQFSAHLKALNFLQTSGTENPVSVKKTASIYDVLNTLVAEHIRCVLIMDDDESYLGTVDMLDILCYFCSKLSNTLSVEEVEDYLQNNTIEPLIDYSGRNRWIAVSGRSTLEVLINVLSNPLHDRVGVSDQGKVVGLVCHGDVISWLHRNTNFLPKELLRRPVSEFSCSKGCRALLPKVKISDTLHNSFRYMMKNGCDVVAIVDDQGKLVGSISANKIKTVVKDPQHLISSLNGSLRDFLGMEGTSLPDSLALKPYYSLENVLNKFQRSGAQKMWVVDSDDVPTVCIGLHEVLHELATS
mmetsp:Transcript_45281/g.113994  ORF Transcript_45281/g.113994 Transcript_45281/m.113994 type:complete len:302 (-) Transcript_45281:133-1038(-)